MNDWHGCALYNGCNMRKARTCSELIRERYKRPDSERGSCFVALNLLKLAVITFFASIPYLIMALTYYWLPIG